MYKENKMKVENRKFNVIYEGSVMNRSGYGEWSDGIFQCLYQYPLFNLNVIPNGWGTCQPRQTKSEVDDLIRKCIPQSREIPQPDIYICQTLPHMKKPQGRMFNVCITAGIEVDRCYDYIIDGVNQWDLVITTSGFSKTVFLNSPKKVTKPIEVIGWSADTKLYKMTSDRNAEVDSILDRVKEDEAFLFVGQSTSQHLFGDRKDMSSLIKTFCETFKGKDKKPALVLKTSGVNFSTFDRNVTLERINHIKNLVPDNDVNVYVIHGELTSEQMNALYNHPKIIANASFTHGEGWGQPLLQSSLAGKPVFAPNWSGHLDFLPTDKAVLLEGKVDRLPDHLISEYFMKDSQWFTVDYEKAGQKMLDFVYGDRSIINANAARLAVENSNKFNMDKMSKRYFRVFDKYLLGKG
jgi:hypothetical protein